jgi:MFS family permease
MSAASPFRALAHRNFRLYLAGQGVSIIGTWTQQVAMAWLVYQLTGSPLWLGVVGFAGQIPALFLTPLAGALIDRCDRHRLLLFTQTAALAQAAALAVLTLTGAVAAWHVVALSLFLGVLNAFDIPTRQSFLSELVGKGDDLPNAIALNSSAFNGARLVGPALAGLLLALTGPGVCFVANALSYVAVLAALGAMRLPRRQRLPARSRLLGGVWEGLAYAWGSAPLRSLLGLIGLFNIAGMAETTLLPVVATQALAGGSATLALLSAAAGLGAFAAAVLLATRRSVRGLERWVVTAAGVFGLGLIAFSFAEALWAAALLLSVTGFTLLLLTAAANTLLQTLVAEDKRGRVVSLYTMMVTGLAPVGGLLAGLLADRVGAAPALRLAGLLCVGGWALFGARSRRLPAGASPAARLPAPADGEAARGVVGHNALGEAVRLQPVQQALGLPRVQGAALAPPLGVRRRAVARFGRCFISP